MEFSGFILTLLQFKNQPAEFDLHDCNRESKTGAARLEPYRFKIYRLKNSTETRQGLPEFTLIFL